MKKLSDRKLYERSLSEEDVIGQIRSLLELNGARIHRIVERIPWGKKTSTPGIPDLYGYFYRMPPQRAGFVLPLHFWVEVKKPGGKLRPRQIAFLEALTRDGVIAFKAESVEETVSAFKRWGVEIKGLQNV